MVTNTMNHYIIGLDQGTTGTTGLLFDATQKIVQKSYKEHRQYFPQAAWVEHDATEIMDNVIEIIRELIRNAGIHASQIQGIGLTNQRETSVAWDRETSKPLAHAIVWQCRRTAKACEQIQKNTKLTRKIQKLTGLTVDPYFSATKFAWLIQHTKITNKENLALGTMDSWLIWNLTKGQQHRTDVTNASRTMLFDIQKQQWSSELCKQFKIPMTALAQVQPSISSFGNIHKDFFGSEIPILGVLGDQQASMFAHGAVKPFQAKCTFGTGAFALVHCGKKFRASKNKLLTTLVCSQKSRAEFALEGSVFMAGSIIQWLRDELKIIDHASELDGLANQISSNEGVYLVPAFAGLGAPYWKPNARAVLSGMHLGTNRSHIARATLEAIVYQVCDLFEAIQKDIGKKITNLHVDGGVTNSDFMMQFLANILQITVHKSSMVEMTALGAAKAAATSLGWWKAIETNPSVAYSPKTSAKDAKVLLDGWKKAVQRALIAV